MGDDKRMEESGVPLGIDYCILGYPVSRSASPAIYNNFFARRGMRLVYGLCELEDSWRLEAFVETARTRLRGFNVTIPYKEAIIPFLDELDEHARRIGAVNTVKVSGGRTLATNTDWRGFVEPLLSIAGGLERERAVILGAGGAARAAAYALVERGLSCDIHVLGRSRERMEAFEKHARGEGWGECLHFHHLSQSIVRELVPSSGLLVNATPLGSATYPGETPVSPGLIGEDMVVYDMVYNPVVTPLLRAALERGAMIVDGVCMLAHQAGENIRFWLGLEVDVFELRRYALDYLGEA